MGEIKKGQKTEMIEDIALLAIESFPNFSGGAGENDKNRLEK